MSHHISLRVAAFSCRVYGVNFASLRGLSIEEWKRRRRWWWWWRRRESQQHTRKKKRREERYYIRRQTKKPQGVHIPKSSRCSFFSLFYCATLKVLFFFRFIQESMMTFCARAELCLKFKWQQWCRVELISPVAFAFAFSLSPSLSLSLCSGCVVVCVIMS